MRKVENHCSQAILKPDADHGIVALGTQTMNTREMLARSGLRSLLLGV